MPKRFRIYIDESGDHTYGKMKCDMDGGFVMVDPRAIFPDLNEENKRYFGLTGCIVESGTYLTSFHPRLEELKRNHFHYDPDDPLILHRSDIINRRGSFWILKDSNKEQAFNEDFLCFLREMDYRIITVVIDKKVHIERYQGYAYNPYHYGLGVMLERYCGLLRFINAKGDVLAESRNRNEDLQLKEAFVEIFNEGTNQRPSSFFQGVLTSKEIKIKRKTDNIAGLQVSDLLAYPLKQEILIGCDRLSVLKERLFGKKICEAVKGKYNRHYYNGRIDGYGKVFIK